MGHIGQSVLRVRDERLLRGHGRCLSDQGYNFCIRAGRPDEDGRIMATSTKAKARAASPRSSSEKAVASRNCNNLAGPCPLRGPKVRGLRTPSRCFSENDRVSTDRRVHTIH
jgi:hypothetical protein